MYYCSLFCFTEDLPEPVTDSVLESSQAAALTDPTSASNNTVKSLQNEVVGYQLIIEKLKNRNQVSWLLRSQGTNYY